MEIRKGAQKDKDTIINLWRYSFNNDSDSFINHYFANIYSPENTYLALEENKITTSLQLNPYLFNYNARIIKTKYIVGISSFPENRGSGSVRILFEEIFAELYKDNMPFVFLMGADYGLYTPFGFINILDKYILTGKTKKLFQKTRNLYEFKELSKFSTTEELALLTNFYEENISKNYSYYIIRNSENFRNNLSELLSDKGYGYYLINSNTKEISGYLFYYFDQQKIVVKEMFYENTEVLKEILKFIYNHNTQFDDFEIRDDFYKTTNHFLQNPRETETTIMPFLMARIINLKEFLYLTKIQKNIKEELRIQVKDNLIKENNLLCIIKENEITYLDKYDESDYHLSLDISLLTQLFFGYINKKVGLLHTDRYHSQNDDKKNLFFQIFNENKNIFFNEYV